MKKLIFKYIFLLLIINFCSGQIIPFTDINLKNRLLQADPSNGIAAINYNYYDNSQIAFIKIDSNNNGEIERSEALQVSFLALYNSNITSLSGLEFFVNLRCLNLGFNPLTTANFSTYSQMQSLGLFNNQITNVDLSSMPNLIIFGCENNQITSLNFTNNPVLKKVKCTYNNLTTLDFTNNPLFNDLDCHHNPNLTTIKLKNNQTQLLGSQSMYNECWSSLPSLNFICADVNEIPLMQSYFASCNFNQNITFSNNCLLSTSKNELSEVKIFPNPATDFLNIDLTSTNELYSKIQIVDIIGKIVLETTVKSFAINTISLSFLPSGYYNLKLFSDKNEVNLKLLKN